MLDILKIISSRFPTFLRNAVEAGTVKTMYIDYEKPYVSRLWFPAEVLGKNIRVFIHRIEYTDEPVYFHPHKWESAMLILSGSYEMGIGHSETNEPPKIDCKLILPTETMYEMTEKDSWHYVKPVKSSCYTLMVTGDLNNREMPIESPKEYRKLFYEEIYALLFFAPNMGEITISKMIDKIEGN